MIFFLLISISITMRDIQEFMLTSELRMQQLQSQIDAQQLVIAWLLNQLDRARPETSTSINFLLRQSLALSEGANYEEFVAVFDALAEDCARFSSAEHKQR
ncbi:hypothetical protein [Massilia sp. NR 4-1]|uniref:hypothetical protein n=1 Tax=Massilia sp. NR 4-1 TaxID=1678028 RepID=UPI00067C4AEA|nr:hypothetical protein [Massilia sp. NR 4-1]AKU21895.1 hypothetical protein ACZ75_10865 [Massilia sp. NR 4-1]